MSGAVDEADAPRTSTAEKLGKQLQQLTQRAVTDGVGPLTGSAAYATARGHVGRADGEDPEASIKRIVRESVAASGAQGFVTGVGGIAAMPVTVPANLAGSLIINARMVGAIAHLRGYPLDDPHTQAMITLVAAGSTAQGAISAFGVKLGQKAAMQAIRAVPISVIRQVNKKAGFALVAKYGTQRSAITLAKAVPVAGGIVGGSVDAALTGSIAKVAKRVFPPMPSGGAS
ncbi:EcsC family protein [Nocardioides sp. BYT-33-1]|uniref:EcsC family protein n=1 Tax=Nocardioides sp. BYT-33-1 TaxID=3416952 RepID=UPI003F533479